MAEKNIRMQRKRSDGGFDTYYPLTRVQNVLGNNFDATVPPTEADDASKGYSVGSMWFTRNIVNGRLDVRGYVCLDASQGQAVWVDYAEYMAVDTADAPGPKVLIAGTMQAGFFGEVSASELISGDALASLIGISQGTSQNSTAGWLKFAWQGKILFVAKKAFRNSVSWDYLNSASAVYGFKSVVIDGLSYKIRLLKGANKDPAGAYMGAICHGSEWNRLMLPIHEQAINKNWAYPGNVEDDIPVWAHNLGTGTQGRYTDGDLLTYSVHGNGSYSWCQEVAESSAKRVYRGGRGVSDSLSYTSSDTNSNCGWRPCLEFSV